MLTILFSNLYEVVPEKTHVCLCVPASSKEKNLDRNFLRTRVNMHDSTVAGTDD